MCIEAHTACGACHQTFSTLGEGKNSRGRDVPGLQVRGFSLRVLTPNVEALNCVAAGASKLLGNLVLSSEANQAFRQLLDKNEPNFPGGRPCATTRHYSPLAPQ